MHLVLLSRRYPVPDGSVFQVALLQDTDTGDLSWELRHIARHGRGWVGSSSRQYRTRTDAMRTVRRALYGLRAVA